VSVVRDAPPSPVLRSGSSLATITPIDANFNLRDSRIDEDKYQLAVGYSRPTAHGSWDTLVSVARSRVADVRRVPASGPERHRRYPESAAHHDDDYADTHVTLTAAGGTSLIAGADLLYGLGRQTSLNGNDAYTVPLNGSVLPPSTSASPATEIAAINDKRLFTGLYAQVNWSLTAVGTWSAAFA